MRRIVDTLHEADEVLRCFRMEFCTSVIRCNLHTAHARFEQWFKGHFVVSFLMELELSVRLLILRKALTSHLDISCQKHPCVLHLHRQVRMDALPMLVEELVRKPGLLIEEDQCAKIRLLV